MTIALGSCAFASASAAASPWVNANVAALTHDSDWTATITGCPNGYLDGVSTAIASKAGALKITEGDGTNTGTIVCFTGGDGTSWYEKAYSGASSAGGWMLLAKARGQRIIQCNWNASSWAAGSVGPRALACRGATLLDAIYNDAAMHTIGRPFIAVGHSAGSSLICYALTAYGLKDIIDLAVLTSGPPHSRIDYGTFGAGIAAWDTAGTALCTTGTVIQYASGEWPIIEVAYSSRTYIRDLSCRGGIDNPGERDSILRVDSDLTYPETDMRAVYGDADDTAACPLGRYFVTQVSSTVTENITTGGVDHNGVPGSASGGGYIDAALAAATYNH